MATLNAPPAQFDLPRLEEGILRLWADNDVEGRSLRRGAKAALGQSKEPAFAFNDGPPFATGLPHYGHLLPGTIKDIVPRYQSMCGFAVERRFGWDCHGLPIESLVENDLGVHGQAEIEEYGIDRFNAACRAGVLRFTKEWETMVRRTGRWVDFANDYKTMDASFMETVWWVFRRLWDDDSIYEGFRVQPVSPALGTPLSNFEVAQGPQEKDPVTRKEGHKRVSDPSLTVRFALEDEEGANLWAWTTTPWTLPSNLALAVHPDVTYVKVKIVETGEIAYLEPGRLADYQSRGRIGETEELARMPGRALVGRPYTPLLPFFAEHAKEVEGRRVAFRVVQADYVTVDSGTGIVHQAPAFGEDDYLVGQREGLPMVRPMGLSGVFDGSVGEFEGLFAKDADKPIVARLKKEGKVVDHDQIVHPYPHCYRTDKPLLYMALSTWFMKVERIRDKLVAHNEKIHWVPDHVGSGRFGNWLASARDWNLARNRFWGTPLPIWRCDEDPSDIVCIGSIAELEQLAGLEAGSITDLHRENIDPITFPSKKTPGGTMRRVNEVFDCWFESGSMPYSQNHYPFDEERKQYVEDNLPADFIAEGLDQTRGWFYTLHVLATALFDRPAFKHVIVNGLVLAEDGKKMSKRLKNYPDPSEIISQHGADALRAYLINSAAVRAEPMRFAERGVRDTVRKIVLPLWNAYHFLATYAQADGWTPTRDTLSHPPQAGLDRWILSRVQDFVGQMRAELDAYALSNLVPAFHRICDDLNNWYIRRGRRRYWRGQGEDDRDKTDAYATLFQVLSTVTHAIAPVIPFFSEWMYQRLWVDTGLAGEGEDSVHLRPYPEVEAARRDEKLEADVAAVRQVANLGMAIRERERLAVRRPLAVMTVASPDAAVRAAVEAGRDDLLAELNVKDLRVQEDDGGLVSLSAKANFKVLGRRLGKKMKQIAGAVAKLDAAAIGQYVSTGSIELEGETLGEGDILIVREATGEQAAEAAEGITVVLDTTVSDALRHEGLAREIINRVQNVRKASGLEVSDRISLTLHCKGELAAAAGTEGLAAMIQGETLATAMEVTEQGGSEQSFEIDGETLSVTVTKAE